MQQIKTKNENNHNNNNKREKTKAIFLSVLHLHIQWVSVDSASLIIYPEIKATEASFKAENATSVAFISG